MKEYKRLAPTVMGTALLLTSLLACSGEDATQVMTPEPTPEEQPVARRASEPFQAGAATPASSPYPMIPGRIYAPADGEVTCPSQEFEPFLHAFLNSGDLQARYTASPYVLKAPYHEKHNTLPGDPANPQWAIAETSRPMHNRDRYDAHSRAFRRDVHWLSPGEIWTGVDADGAPLRYPIAELQVRKVSDREYAVDTRDGFTRSRITTFTKHEDCWYLTEDWSLDPFEGCFWPHQCLAMRAYEAPHFDDDSHPARVEATIGAMMQVVAFPHAHRPVATAGARSHRTPAPPDHATDERRVMVLAPMAGVIGARNEQDGLVDILDHESGERLVRFRDMSDIDVQSGDLVTYGQRLGSHHNTPSNPIVLKLEMAGHRYPQFRRYISDLHNAQLPLEHTSRTISEHSRQAGLPDVLWGIWFEDSSWGREQCESYRALPSHEKNADEGSILLIGSVVITSGLIHEYSEYGEGNFYLVSQSTQIDEGSWQLEAALGFDSIPAEDDHLERNVYRLDLKQGRIIWQPFGRNADRSSHYFRCDDVQRDWH